MAGWEFAVFMAENGCFGGQYGRLVQKESFWFMEMGNF